MPRSLRHWIVQPVRSRCASARLSLNRYCLPTRLDKTENLRSGFRTGAVTAASRGSSPLRGPVLTVGRTIFEMWLGSL